MVIIDSLEYFIAKETMKKLLLTLLLVAFSWAVTGTSAQAAPVNSPTMTLAKKHHHHKSHHKKHKKHARA
jgi:Ni/Co efflux regulator RcnB